MWLMIKNVAHPFFKWNNLHPDDDQYEYKTTLFWIFIVCRLVTRAPMASPYCTLVLLFATLTLSSSFSENSANRQLLRMKKLVEITHDQLLAEGCPDLRLDEAKRSLLSTSKTRVHLQMQTKLYEHLLDLIISCRDSRASNTSLSALIPSTTSPIPSECLTAQNLSEPWRVDHNSSDIKPINGYYNGDVVRMIKEGRPWFRFTAAAGNRMLDRCVPKYSCGTAMPYFSNSTMRSALGVPTVIDVYALARPKGPCDENQDKVRVMRCSLGSSDFIYQYVWNETFYSYGFCGMQAWDLPIVIP